MEFIIIYCSVPNSKEAKDIAKVLVKNRFVACVNIIDKVHSVFSWDGELCEENELLLVMKTRAQHFEAVQAKIKELHSYNVPEIIATPIVLADDMYLKWLAHETR